MDAHAFFDWLWGGLAWEVAVRFLALSGLADLVLWVVTKFTFGWKPNRVQFWSAFLGFPALLFVLLIALVPPPPKPSLIGATIRQMGGDVSMNGGPSYPFLVFDMSIANVGTMPTTVDGYGLKAVIDGKEYMAQPVDAEQLWLSIQKMAAPSVPPSDPAKSALFNITRQPIIPGGKVIGRLMFFFPQMMEGDLRPGTHLTLFFFDVFGRRYEINWESAPVPPGRAGGTFVPGFDPFVKPIPPPQAPAPQTPTQEAPSR